MQEQVISDILNGKLDDQLEGIYKAIKERRDRKSRDLMFTLKVGSKVRLVNTQKYLEGATGTVKEIARTRIRVDLDEPRGRFFKDISCPPSLLQPIQ